MLYHLPRSVALVALVTSVWTFAAAASPQVPGTGPGDGQTVGLYTGVESFAPTDTRACTVALDRLSHAWAQLGLQEPSKPGQMRVLGSRGITISGQDYATVTSQMRWAAADCQHGRPDDALARISRVQPVLDRAGPLSK